MKRITPFLWFATEAEEAAEYYVGIFPNSRISSVTRYGEGGPCPQGLALTVAFNLDGEDFVALNGQRPIPHTAAISFVVNCTTQEEVDHFWTSLSASHGDRHALDARDYIGEKMSVEQVNEGKRLVHEYEEKVEKRKSCILCNLFTGKPAP